MGELPRRVHGVLRSLRLLPASARQKLEALVAAPRRGVARTERISGAAGRAAGESRASPSPRYEDLGSIARGGMGEVRRMRDRAMGRVLAMKLLYPEDADDAEARARFIEEAKLTATLQHPAIVPVHDFGTLADGRPWFTMKEVRGTTLRGVIEALHAEPPSAPALRRVVDAYLRACEAVAYAHRRGVIHRDLKPDNIMVGEFGEVLLMDWGLALGARGRTLEPDGRHGEIVGTPAYMPPEQGRGELEAMGPASDVYALGAILYEIVSGQPPYAGTSAAVLAQLSSGPPARLGERAPGAPEDLIAICERAMARQASARFADARELVDELRSVLDGARRRERAEALVESARELASRADALRERARAVRAGARALLARLETFDPAEEKARGWAMEDEAEALEGEAAAIEAAWSQQIHAALHEDAGLPAAHAALADAHAAALQVAERERDAVSAARAEALLRVHDRGRHAALLRGDGALTLHTDPPGAEVLLHRYVERGGRLVAEPLGSLGRTPLAAVPLSRGSYLLRLRAPGRGDVLYPVSLGRGEHWNGVRPGDRAPFPIPLPRLSELAPDDCYVPAGYCAVGGDPAASEALSGRSVWVDGFVMRRYPVTQREYLAFLNDLVARGDHAEAEACCPRVSSSITGDLDVPLFLRDAEGLYRAAPSAVSAERHPAVSMSWHGAARAARWFAQGGEAWRLPGELEREKAARGVDGRFMPWGDRPEPTWACMVGSRRGPPALAPIDAFATDESPYGVRGLAGNVRDWCLDAWTPDGPATLGDILRVAGPAPGDPALRSIRGGAWMAAPPLCRSAGRFAAEPDDHFAGVGVRLVRPL